MSIALQAGQSTRDYIPAHSVPWTTGLFYEIVSGTLEGSVAIYLGTQAYVPPEVTGYEPIAQEVYEGVTALVPSIPMPPQA